MNESELLVHVKSIVDWAKVNKPDWFTSDNPPSPPPTSDFVEINTPILLMKGMDVPEWITVKEINNVTHFILEKHVVAKTFAFVIADNIVLDLNQRLILFNKDNADFTTGVHIYRGSGTNGTIDSNFALLFPILEGQYLNIRPEIHNGYIIAYSFLNTTTKSFCVGGSSVDNIFLQNLLLCGNTGTDNSVVEFRWGTVQTDNVLSICNSTATNDRHAGPGNIKSQSINARNTHLIGGNSGFVGIGGTVSIDNCVIQHSAIATNCYGIWLYACNNCKITNNTIVPLTAGRGIILSNVDNSLVKNNKVIAFEHPNSEYDTHLNACAMRLRYNSHNNSICNNSFIALSSKVKNHVKCSAIYLSSDFGKYNVINDNVTMVIADTHTCFESKHFTFESHSGKTNIFNNIIYDNADSFIFSTSGEDGLGKNYGNIYNNKIVKLNLLEFKRVLDGILIDMLMDITNISKIQFTDVHKENLYRLLPNKEDHFDWMSKVINLQTHTQNLLYDDINRILSTYKLVNNNFIYCGFLHGEEYLKFSDIEYSHFVIDEEKNLFNIYLFNTQSRGRKSFEFPHVIVGRNNESEKIRILSTIH